VDWRPSPETTVDGMKAELLYDSGPFELDCEKILDLE
jgi:hypothetical protein